MNKFVTMGKVFGLITMKILFIVMIKENLVYMILKLKKLLKEI